MRNKIYICVIAAIFGILFLWCPVSFAMEKAGIMAIEDLANYKDPEKVYYYDPETNSVKIRGFSLMDEEQNTDVKIPAMSLLYMNFFNGIENGKAALNTVYTNYLPFYANILKFINSNESAIQDDFVMMLFNMEEAKLASAPPEVSENVPPSEGEEGEETTAPAQPVVSSIRFIASKIADAGMFRVYRVRSADNSLQFLDISIAMAHDVAAKNMLDEQAHINRIAAADPNVNFYVYIATRMQDTEYYNTVIPSASEQSTYDIFTDFINGITGVAGIAWFDIDTLEERLERGFLTDHHWNALGAYQGYTEVIEMMRKGNPDIGDLLPLKGLIEYPNVEYRGSGAARTQTPDYYDPFAVMDIDLPVQHQTERVTTPNINDYESGRHDAGKTRNIYTSHYENYYNRPSVITYPENNTGRRLLILGDSYVYWVSWLIGAHFDKTFVHYTLDGQDLNYHKFIEDNGITDVLLLQYSSRTLSKATSATKYLEQVITK